MLQFDSAFEYQIIKIIMNQLKNVSNHQIAEIYDNMISGDKSALFKLQQINSRNYIPKHLQSYYNRKNKGNNLTSINQSVNQIDISESKVQNKQFKQISSVPTMQTNKDLTFANAIKRGAKFDALNDRPRIHSRNVKRFVNSSNRASDFHEKGEVSKQVGPIKQVKQSLPNEIDYKINLDKSLITKNKAYFLPKVHKGKESSEPVKIEIVSTQSQKKGPALDSLQKSKMKIKRQKVDFQDIILKNRQKREQFEKKNGEQRQLQLQIMKYHSQTRDFVDEVKEKYKINFNNKLKYQKRKSKLNEQNSSNQLKPSHSEQKISPFKMAMKNQTERCQQIQNQIAHLKILFAKNSSILRKIEKQKQGLLFNRYLDRYGLQIQEQIEEQTDTVEPLLEDQGNQRGRYKYLMAKTRQKKWSLIQRTQYQAQRTNSLQQSRQANTTSRSSMQAQLRMVDQSANKVTVNQRLKNLLFS